MKKYRVQIVFRTLEIYEVEAEDAATATDLWAEGRLIHRSDEALDSEVLSVQEV
jgi:hypothetical protein